MVELVYFIASLLVAVTIHECSHALVAYKLGDPTAKNAGRISLNPLDHLDVAGTLMLIFAHIGWGKPVPVNPHYFKHPKRDGVLTALAGPFSTLVLAFVLTFPLKYGAAIMPQPLHDFLAILWEVSIALFVFNMLPFPPLDGSSIVGIFVPRKYEHYYQRYLQNGVLYFLIFMVFDQFVLQRIFGWSIVGGFIVSTTTFFESLLYLGI